MIEAFLAWWAQHLLAWLPTRLRGAGRRPDAVIAEMLPAGGGLALFARRGGREAPLGRFGPGAAGEAALRSALAAKRRLALLVRPAPGALLARPVELPLAAERDLGQVLRYEMDRLTPFAPDDLYWGWEVERRDRARGRLHVRLLLAPRAAIEPALAALRRAGAQPAALEAAGAPPIPLDPARPGRERRRRRVLAAMAAVCAALALVVAGLPFALQSAAAREVERRIARLRPQVDQAQALRQRVASGAAGANVLAQQRAATGDALAALATATNLLPDDTYLTELTLHGRVLTLSGQSGAAARLIAALSADPGVRDPAFTAPVTRNEAARADQFSLRAELAP